MHVVNTFYVLLGVTLASTCVADTVQVERFEREYPVAAERLQKQLETVQGSCLMWHSATKTGRPKLPAEADFAFDGGQEKVAIRIYRADGKTPHAKADPHTSIVYSMCVAEKTLLHLVKNSGSADFKIQNVKLNTDDKSVYVDMFGRFPRVGMSLIGRNITGWLTKKNFKLLDAERTTKDGRELVRIRFEDGATDSRLIGTLDLDPAEGWIIRSGEYGYGNSKRRVKIEATYYPRRNGVMRPHLVSFQSPTGYEFCEFTDWRDESTPEGEFRLPYFNLPDVAKSAHAAGGTKFYWLTGLLGLCSAVGLGFFVQSRRGRTK